MTSIVRTGRWPIRLLLLAAVVAGLALGGTARAQQPVTEANVNAAVAQLDGVVNDVMTRTNIPGMAVAVVYKDQVIYLKGFGIRETGKEGRVDPDTVFQLASLSKPIASTLMAALVGDGVITWDDPLVKHTPDFALADPFVTSSVTLRDMFAHRSGLPDHAGDLLEDLGYSREDTLYRLRFIPLGNRFRSVYNYTNFGITAAGVAGAAAAGGTWEDVITRRLFEPLGMTSTSPRSADFFNNPDRAYGHVLVDGKYVAKYRRDPDTESPAGGVSSSVRDLTRWMRLQLNGGAFEGRRLVDEKALAETHVPHMVSNPPANPNVNRAGFYGLGWNVSYTDQGLVQISHSGAFELGAGTAVYMLPGQQLGIVVLGNVAAMGGPEAVALSFMDLVLAGKVQNDYIAIFPPFFARLAQEAAGYDTDYSKRPTSPTAALPLDAYIGAYENDYFGPFEIIRQGDGLAIVQGPKKLTFPLRHYDRDTFVYQPEGENAGGPAGVTFTIGPDGKAERMVVENLQARDDGRFNRVRPAR